jgi:hypothetical protein
VSGFKATKETVWDRIIKRNETQNQLEGNTVKEVGMSATEDKRGADGKNVVNLGEEEQ